MTSLEIVELTGKEHKNILADIRDELEKLVNKGIRAELIFQPGYYLDKNNQQRPMYTLTKEGVLQLAARYDAVVRFKLIERVTQQTPQSFSQALYLAAEQQAQIEKLQLDKQVQAQQIAELQPKATYYDLILQNNSLLSVTQIAKDYGMSAQALNSKLHELGVQFNQGGVWLLYQQHAPYGYTHSKTQNYNKSDGSQGSRVHTYWTQKGRIFLYELLKKNGIVPLIERVDQS
jgi:prophage antirepressor